MNHHVVREDLSEENGAKDIHFEQGPVIYHFCMVNPRDEALIRGAVDIETLTNLHVTPGVAVLMSEDKRRLRTVKIEEVVNDD